MTRAQRARFNANVWWTVIVPRARVHAMVYLAYALSQPNHPAVDALIVRATRGGRR